jgi:hypothetical protein
VKFIPQNITFEVQLSYQGSTQAAKSWYCQQMLQ